MTSFAHVDYRTQHPGVVRAEHIAQAIGDLSRRIGSASAAARGWLQRWAAARKQAREDEKLWNVALQDSRVMADISRAMNASARDFRTYY